MIKVSNNFENFWAKFRVWIDLNIWSYLTVFLMLIFVVLFPINTSNFETSLAIHFLQIKDLKIFHYFCLLTLKHQKYIY